LAEKDGLKSGILGTRSCSPVETLSDGATADAVYIVINAPHRDLLNQVESRPLDYLSHGTRTRSSALLRVTELPDL